MSNKTYDWYRHAGDIADSIVVKVSPALGDTLSYVASVSAVLRDRITGTEVSRTATVTDSTEREVTVDLGTWLQNTAVAGEVYLVSLTIVTNGGSTVTFPEALGWRPTLGIV